MTTSGSARARWERDWWHDAVVYQIYPRSFADGNGDGVGDLRGIIDRLDHLGTLGIDAVWLSPIFRSPMADFGYDVADYCSVDPVFGTDADLDELIAGLHARGIRLLLDWVPNHTSDQHPWFEASRSSRTDPRRDWYIWRDRGADGTPPNNWIASFKGVPAWTHDPRTDQSYLHLFLAEQPDLNWHNPEVEAAMHDTLRHWLDRGVDGFRADVVHAIGKDPGLADLTPERARGALIEIDEPFTHELLRRIRRVLDEYDHRPMMVGEVYLLRDGQTVTYLGDDDELHLTFDFRALHSPWDADALRIVIDKVQREFAPPRWPTWVLSNHDQPRVRTLCGSEAAARGAAVLSLTMRGTPFLYAGDEFGLADAVVPPELQVDPGGRDGTRAPIPWTTAPGHGWGPDPWLPFPPDADRLAAAAQQHDPTSMLHLYRRLLDLRRRSAVLRSGDIELIDTGHPEVIGYRRWIGDDWLVVYLNLAADTRHIDAGTRTAELVASSIRERDLPGTPFGGGLAAHEAVILGPAGVAPNPGSAT